MGYSLKSMILVIALFVLLPGSAFSQPRSSNDKRKSDDREFLIQFSQPMSPAEVIAVVKKTKIKAKELLYELPGEQDDVIAGGYVLDPGQDVDDAVADMSKKHTAFLEEALKNVTEQLNGSSDPATTENLKKLQKTFTKLLDETKANRFRLNGLKAADVPDVSALERSSHVQNIVEVVKPASSQPPSQSSPVFQLASYYHERWAPYYGTAQVNQSYTFQTFYFNNVSDFGSNSTYEHETQVSDKRFADYANYWSSNLPYAYKDTPFLDSIDNFTVGSSRAVYLRTYVYYYTYMALRPGTVYTSTVRIKGQKGYRSPSWCTSTWCIWPDATTSTAMTTFTAPIYYNRVYNY